PQDSKTADDRLHQHLLPRRFPVARRMLSATDCPLTDHRQRFLASFAGVEIAAFLQSAKVPSFSGIAGTISDAVSPRSTGSEPDGSAPRNSGSRKDFGQSNRACHGTDRV